MASMQILSASGIALGTLWETYRYPVGAADATPAHVHDTYQICVSVNFPGESRYRGSNIAIPEQSLTVFHPGEPHSSRDRDDRNRVSEFRILYFTGAVWQDSGATNGVNAPFFREPLLTDPAVFRRVLQLHQAVCASGDTLQTETMLCETLRFLESFATGRIMDEPASLERGKIRHVRGYIQEGVHKALRLDELAGIAGLSKYHFLRLFRAEVGMPPHAYQTQLRVDRARHLLLHGVPIGSVAAELGFADQSHLTRTFRHIVGCTPRQYVAAR